MAGAASGSLRAAERGCSLEIEGVWRTEESDQLALLSFTADGWANVLGTGPEQRAGEFDILAQVGYEVDDERRPQYVSFVARRGNDVFPPGESAWEIVAYDDTNLVTRTPEAQSRWTRVATGRYFLTFADRPGNTATQSAATVVAWTSLGERKTDVEALGVQRGHGQTTPRFGGVRAEAVAELVGRARESDVVLRVELNAAEYRRSRRMLEAWETLASTGVLADDDPYRLALDFVQTVLQSVNRCRQTLRLRTEDAARLDDVSVSAELRLHAVVRALRKENAGAHVSDAAFPTSWTPQVLESQR